MCLIADGRQNPNAGITSDTDTESSSRERYLSEPGAVAGALLSVPFLTQILISF